MPGTDQVPVEPGALTRRPAHQESSHAYIDGFVIAVPTANRQKFIELGAVRVVESRGDDVGG
jgi:hypothetical protein